MPRKALKLFGWTLAALVGLACLLYGVAVAVNWKDRPPSASALRLEELYRSRPTVPDQDNAFVFLMGFGADPEEDPVQLGLKRMAWLRETNAQEHPQWINDPLGERGERPDSRSELVRSFLDSCRGPQAHCTELLAQWRQIHDQWIAAEPWLLERYRQLIRYGEWSEVVPLDPAFPVPRYIDAMHGQRLLLLRASVLANAGEVQVALELLEDDLRFWRMVLASADVLLTKMIATSALNRHFKMGSLVLRSMPADAAGVTPSGWLTPFSGAELSIRRMIVGEWMFTKGVILKNIRSDLGWAEQVFFDRMPLGLSDRMALALSDPLFQPQDTINRLADRYLPLAERFDLPLSERAMLPDEAGEPGDLFTIYNPIGSLLAAKFDASYDEYAARTADIEGVRRAALAAAELRRMAVVPDEIPDALQRSSWRNPYDGAPFEWREDNRTILFNGLTTGDRAEHRIYY